MLSLQQKPLSEIKDNGFPFLDKFFFFFFLFLSDSFFFWSKMRLTPENSPFVKCLFY